MTAFKSARRETDSPEIWVAEGEDRVAADRFPSPNKEVQSREEGPFEPLGWQFEGPVLWPMLSDSTSTIIDWSLAEAIVFPRTGISLKTTSKRNVLEASIIIFFHLLIDHLSKPRN